MEAFELSGLLPVGMSFPLDFGMIPATLADDGGPLEFLVIGDEPSVVGCVVDVCILGVIKAEQTERGRTYRNDRLVGRVACCAALRDTKDGRWVNLAGLVLLRQKPGSAKGVMFITLEDETDVANLVVWPNLFETHRRIVLGASMMGVRGQVQREGDVIHAVVQKLDDLSPLLASVGRREDVASVYQVSRADIVKNAMAPEPRASVERVLSRSPRDIYIPDLRLGSGIIPVRPTEGIKIKPRDFR